MLACNLSISTPAGSSWTFVTMGRSFEKILSVQDRLFFVLTFTELETDEGTSGLPELLVPHPLQD